MHLVVCCMYSCDLCVIDPLGVNVWMGISSGVRVPGMLVCILGPMSWSEIQGPGVCERAAGRYRLHLWVNDWRLFMRSVGIHVSRTVFRDGM